MLSSISEKRDRELDVSDTKIVWNDKFTRDEYIKYYENNLTNNNHILSLDFNNSNHDILLVARVHDSYNEYLLESGDQKLPKNFFDSLDSDIIMNIINNGGWIFPTICCSGWVYGMTNCLCGKHKMYLHTKISDLTNFSIFNLKSTSPIGTATILNH